MKRAVSILFLLLSCGIFSAVYFFNLRPQPPETTQNNLPQIELSPRLSNEEFQAEHLKLRTVADAKGLQAAFEALKSDMEQDEKVLNSCHELLHVFGRSMFEKYGNFTEAVRYQDEVCVSGYIHGVLEGYLAVEPRIDVALKEVCNTAEPHTYRRTSCYHGVGHALMFYSQNNLPLSLEKCDLYRDPTDNSDCYSGAYMENFNMDQKEHLSTYLDPSRPLYPCTVNTKNLDACYAYAPLYFLGLHKDDYNGALAVCDSADKAYRASCYFGVGFQYVRRHLKDISSVQAVCDASTAARTSCINGAAYYYLSYYLSKDKTRTMCSTLNLEDAATCAEAVDTFANLLKDFK